MIDWSSEKIAKALKGSGFSHQERINTATQAWNNNTLFFPNKDDFLFEWLCSALTMKSNMKSLMDSPLFYTQYWQLLYDLLRHYISSGSIPFIRVPLLIPVSTVLATPHTTVLEAMAPCIRLLLLDPVCRSAYHPSLEQLTAVVEHLLPALQQPNDALVDLAKVVLTRYDEQLVQAGNQKKMFTTMITKVMPSGLSIRHQSTDAQVSQKITELLCHCLFHQDTILEYTSVLTTQNTKNASYVSRLFEELSKLMDAGKAQDVLSILPILLSQFITAFRRKKHTTMAPTQEINRLAEFGFFMQVHGIMEKGKPAATALKVEAMLLEQVLTLNIYAATNDTVSKQHHEFLDSLATRAVDCLGNPEDYDQGFVMDIINFLLQIDITLIEPRMTSIWPVLLQPSGNSDSCLSLAQTVLKSYAASRQVDMFVAELLSAITTASIHDIFTVLSTPLFSKCFLQEFSSIVAKQVPAPQTLVIFELFTATLKTDPQHPKKKAKRDTCRSTSALLITTYLVEFIHALRLGQHQRQAFERTAQELFTDFIQPSFDHQILPAIQVHFALSHTFYDVYWLKLSHDAREWLVLELKNLFEHERHGNTLISRFFLVHSANVLLQHVYFSGLQGGDAFHKVNNAELVNVVLERVLEDHVWQEASWDGQWGSLNDMDRVKLAIWKLVTDEWFDPVCRVLQEDEQKAQRFASLVLLSTHKQNHPDTSLTMQSLNTTLLRSAHFYETKCFHDRSIDMLIDSIIKLFQDKNDDLAMEIVKIKQYDEADKVALGKTLIQSLDLPMKSSDINQVIVDTIGRLMNLLLLFPLEYFAKHQRAPVLWLCLLVDAWLWTYGMARSPLRGSLACRSLIVRLASNSNAGALQANASILHWWVHVLDSRLTNDLVSSLPADAQAWTQVTKLLDYKVLTTILSMAGGKSPDANATAFLQDTLHYRFKTSTKWTLNFMEALVDYLPTLIKKQDRLETSDLLGTVPEMEKMAHRITHALKPQQLDSIPVTELAELFHGATLVLAYAHALNQSGRDMDMTVLSGDVVRLIPAMMTRLQTGSYLAVYFAAAVSATPSLSADKTMDVFWVVFTHSVQDKPAMDAIGGVFSKWIQGLAKEQYAIVVDHLAGRLDTADGQTLLAVMFLLLTRTNEGQKYRLRPMIPHFMLKLTTMVNTTTQIEFLDHALDLLIRLTNEPIFVNNSYDTSLVLSCLLQSLHPSTQSILTPKLDRAHAQSIFGKICHILVNLARLHRDPLSDTMGPMLAILQILLQSFKSAHLSLINTSKKRKSTTATATTATATSTLLTAHAPLDPICAERYARICTQLVVKPAGGTQRSDTVHHNILKQVPFILMAYFNGQSDPVCTITTPALKGALASAWYELLDVCSATDRSLVMTALNPTGQALFKSFYGTWKSEHKYSGQ